MRRSRRSDSTVTSTASSTRGPAAIVAGALAMATLATACTDGAGSPAPTSTLPSTLMSTLPSTLPSTLTSAGSWQWQLQGDVDTSVDADLYDVDLFDTPDAVLEELQSANRIVICYFSAGSYEAWRDDVDRFAPGDLGTPLDGWDDERWLDIRSATVRSLMETRLDLAAERGCDGVEPDNVTAFTNDTGFEITAAEQLDYNRFLANAAAERGLLIGLKNALDLIPDLVDDFDFAVNEQCHEYDECEVYAPFIAQGKPVFNAEYADRFVDDPDAVCERSQELGLWTLVLPVDLDGSFRLACDG